jgi:hypothetical protein
VGFRTTVCFRMLDRFGPGRSHCNQTGAAQPDEWAIVPFHRMELAPPSVVDKRDYHTLEKPFRGTTVRQHNETGETVQMPAKAQWLLQIPEIVATGNVLMYRWWTALSSNTCPYINTTTAAPASR